MKKQTLLTDNIVIIRLFELWLGLKNTWIMSTRNSSHVFEVWSTNLSTQDTLMHCSDIQNNEYHKRIPK